MEDMAPGTFSRVDPDHIVFKAAIAGDLPPEHQRILWDEFVKLQSDFPLSSTVKLGYTQTGPTQAYDLSGEIGIDGQEVENDVQQMLAKLPANVDHDDAGRDALRFIMAHEYAHMRQGDAVRVPASTKFAERINTLPPTLAYEMLTNVSSIPQLTSCDVLKTLPAYRGEWRRRLECQADILAGYSVFDEIAEENPKLTSDGADNAELSIEDFTEVISNVENGIEATHPDQNQRKLAARDGYYRLRGKLAERESAAIIASEAQNHSGDAKVSNTSQTTTIGQDPPAQDTGDQKTNADLLADLKDEMELYSNAPDSGINDAGSILDLTLARAERIMGYPQSIIGEGPNFNVSVEVVSAGPSSLHLRAASDGQDRYDIVHPYTVIIKNILPHRTVTVDAQIDWVAPGENHQVDLLRARNYLDKVTLKPGDKPVRLPLMVTVHATRDENAEIRSTSRLKASSLTPIITYSASTDQPDVAEVDSILTRTVNGKTLYGIRNILTADRCDVEWIYKKVREAHARRGQEPNIIIRPNSTAYEYSRATFSLDTPFDLWHGHIYAEPDFFNTVMNGRFIPKDKSVVDFH